MRPVDFQAALLTGFILLGLVPPSRGQAPAPFIDIGAAAEEALFKKASAVRIGSTVESVIAEMGKPTHDKRLADKHGKIVSRALYYYSKKFKKGVVNELDDRYVAFYFDPTGMLTEKQRKEGK